MSIGAVSEQTPYCTIREAAARSGLSAYLWRHMIWDNRIPHIMSGNIYYVNYPVAMQYLQLMPQRVLSRRLIAAQRSMRWRPM